MASFTRVSFTFTALLCVVVIAIAGVQNWAILTPLVIFNHHLAVVPLGAIILGVFAVTALGALIRLGAISQRLGQNMQYAQLRKEKADVRAEVASDHVQVLESKIQTLEKALERAMTQSNS